MKILRCSLFILLTLTIMSCAKDENTIGKKDPLAGIPEQELYQRGERALSKADYEKASQHFESLDSQYPFGSYSQAAMRDLIYAYFKSGDTSAAAATAKRYIHLYPRAQDVDYAYYMRGVAEFEQDHGILARFLPFDPSKRDPGTMMDAYNDFSVFLQRFPRSRYAADVSQRMIYLRNLFSKKELAAAEFYWNRQAYVAASNRASYLVRTFPQAPEAARALDILYKANLKLGLQREADDALRVLKHNYPEYVI